MGGVYTDEYLSFHSRTSMIIIWSWKDWLTTTTKVLENMGMSDGRRGRVYIYTLMYNTRSPMELSTSTLLYSTLVSFVYSECE